MAPHLEKLGFGILQAELRREGWGISLHQDPAGESSVKAVRAGKEMYVTLFGTGTIRVNPAGNSACEGLRDGIKQHLERLQHAVHQTLGREAYEFLDEPDRECVLDTRFLCEGGPNLIDYAALVMPLAKAFEGFAKKLLIRLNVSNPAALDDPAFFRLAFGSAAYQALMANAADKKVLERLRNELPFSRHGLMHSPPHNAFVLRDRAAALAKEGDILTLIRETFAHFKGRI
jgi:hypothetical protein